MKHLEKIIAVLMLLFAVGFNLWLYRLEPTALSDPNDNTFQFALVDRTNQIWDFALRECAKTPFTYPVCFVGYLVDHWVPNWAQGYNLPYYYSHLPQIFIVGGYRLLTPLLGDMTLFTYYHWIIYLLLCIFPISVFAALRIARTSWLTAGIGALIASQLSTDGLYGLDPSSFLWRGYGLSSQMFAMVWFPVAVASAYRFVTLVHTPASWQTMLGQEFRIMFHPLLSALSGLYRTVTRTRKKAATGVPDDPAGVSRWFWLSVIFGVATTAGHLGIGIMAIFSIGFLGLAPIVMAIMDKQPLKEIFQLLMKQSVRMGFLVATIVFFLSYWIIPTQLHGNFHNISVWDPVWKFDSYGWGEVLNMFFNGHLFDFGRFPIVTLLVIVGAFAGFRMLERSSRTEPAQPETITDAYPLAPFSFLLVFWMLLFFGRATWGGLIDLIPGMKEVHLSRFIVGVHLAGLFLAPIGFVWCAQQISHQLIRFLSYAAKLPSLKTNAGLATGILWIVVIAGLAWLMPSVYAQTIRYNDLNNTLILQANDNYLKEKDSLDELFRILREKTPGRIYAGRSGWGSKFEIAETPYNMMLSTYGLSTVMWLPETWSPNSDTEQYFSEDVPNNYDLYNIRYVVTPPTLEPKPFWTLIDENPDWKLYEVKTSGYITVGAVPMVFSTGKETFLNVVHQWIQSPQHADKLYPELTFNKHAASQLPLVRMIDEVTYENIQGQQFNIFANPPLVTSATPSVSLVGPERNIADMIFSSTVKVDAACVNCVTILRHTDHPNWRVRINGKPAARFTVFPFFVAARLQGAGTYTVEFSYQPSTFKMLLLALAVATGTLTMWGFIRSHRSR